MYISCRCLGSCFHPFSKCFIISPWLVHDRKISVISSSLFSQLIFILASNAMSPPSKPWKRPKRLVTDLIAIPFESLEHMYMTTTHVCGIDCISYIYIYISTYVYILHICVYIYANYYTSCTTYTYTSELSWAEALTRGESCCNSGRSPFRFPKSESPNSVYWDMYKFDWCCMCCIIQDSTVIEPRYCDSIICLFALIAEFHRVWLKPHHVWRVYIDIYSIYKY